MPALAVSESMKALLDMLGSSELQSVRAAAKVKTGHSRLRLGSGYFGVLWSTGGGHSLKHTERATHKCTSAAG